MILFDENITEDQLLKLEAWRIKGKSIGVDFLRKGTSDENVISELHNLKGVLFVSRDSDFFKRELCHSNYAIVYLDVERDETADYIRKFLNHALFNSMKKRLGKVVKINQTMFSFYEVKKQEMKTMSW